MSEGFRDEDVQWLLRDRGVLEVKGEQRIGTRVYVNGDLIGITDNARVLVSEIRAGRRQGLLSHGLNVRHDEEMDEVIINCDEGRLRRPLLVVQDGRLVITRKHIEDMRDGKIRWSDVLREGIMEWIDAEEEEDSFIVVEP